MSEMNDATEMNFNTVKPVKKKKKNRFFIVLLVILGVLVLATVSLYAFVPGLLRPYNLGVKVSEQAYQSALEKLGITKDSSQLSKSGEAYTVIYGAPQTVNASLTSEEITSFLAESFPSDGVENMQMRINSDNTAELSATVHTNYLFSTVLAGKYTKEQAEQELPMLGLLPEKINFYCSFSGSIQENKLENLNVIKISVLGVELPLNMVNDNIASVTEAVNSYLNSVLKSTGTVLDSVQFSNSVFSINGQLPSSLTLVPKK